MVKLIWGCDRCGTETVTQPPDERWRERPAGWRYDSFRDDLNGHQKLLCGRCVGEVLDLIDSPPQARPGPPAAERIGVEPG